MQVSDFLYLTRNYFFDDDTMAKDLKKIHERLGSIHNRVSNVLFNTVDIEKYSKDLVTERIGELLGQEGAALDDISEKLLSISEMLLDYYHHFVDLKRQTREKNQLFINDVLQEINRDILKPLLKQKHPMAQVFPRASHWMAFTLLPPYEGKCHLFEHRLRAVAEYSSGASAIVLIVMAARVRQGRNDFKYTDFLYDYIPLLTFRMINDLDNLFSNQDHTKAKKMAFALINGLMVPVRDRSEYNLALKQWEEFWHSRGVEPSKIIKEIFERFPEFIHAERLQVRFAGGYASGEDVKLVAGLSHRDTGSKSLYEFLTAVHSVAFRKDGSFQERTGWLGVPFEIDHLKDYVGYEQKTGLEGLFNTWSLGRSFYNELILQARRLGFRGHIVKHGRKEPFLGYDTVEISPPAAFNYLKTMFIYQMGAYENLIQHAGGNGVYLWRETLLGYEFIMFDYGRGVRDIDEESLSLDKLSTIFNYGVTFREGKKGPGRTHKESGLGKSFFYLANETYLTRLISITKDRTIRVIEKARPGKDQGEEINTVGAEFSFEEMGFDYRYATGVVIQGFVPFNQGYRTVEYAPISLRSILGQVVAGNGEERRRGYWQDIPETDVLDELSPGDEIEFVSYETEEVDTLSSFTKTVSHTPSPASPQFVFDDGATFAISGIVRLESYGKEIVFSNYDDPFKAVNALGVFALDEVTVHSRTKGVKQLEKVVKGVVKEVPSSDNQGTFVVKGSDGRETFVGPEQIFQLRKIDSAR